jgi:hypothetical protein
MKVRVFSVLCLVACLALSIAVFGQAKKAADPLSGTWTGDWGPSAADRNQVTVEFHFDGKALTGKVNPGPNEVALQKASFDPATSTIKMEAEAKNPRGGAMVRYMIEGKLANNTMTGSWNHDNRKGDFKITKK